MIDDMGIFRTTIELSRWPGHETRLLLRDVMVDTGSEYSWIPRTQLEEGLNRRIDIASKELVPAGPVPVALASAA
jgi:hypothetical protein